jgi:hypothetical protein
MHVCVDKLKPRVGSDEDDYDGDTEGNVEGANGRAVQGRAHHRRRASPRRSSVLREARSGKRHMSFFTKVCVCVCVCVYACVCVCV